MSFNFENLDTETRAFMLKEFDLDISQNRLFISPRLSEIGISAYPQLIRNAILNGNEVSLANSLNKSSFFVSQEPRKTTKGVIYAKVPKTAYEMIAEGEFNRFYMRGLCLRVLENKIDKQIQVYRAKNVERPRSESEAKIGSVVDPVKLLDDLRINIGVDTALGLPAGPNSGLSVRLPS